MSPRDAGAAGHQARHARDRLQSTLGEGPHGLLQENGGEPFQYEGPGPAAAGPPDPEPRPAEAAGLGPPLRWRLGWRLAVLLGVLAVGCGAWFWWQALSGRPEILPLSGTGPGTNTSEPAREPGPTATDAGGGRDGPAEGAPGQEAQAQPADSAGGQDSKGGDSAGKAVVHVAGAVARPGVVQLPAGSRVHDAITAAGGAVQEADLDRLNLALVVQDGQKIHVPVQGEPEEDLPGSTGGGEPGSGSGGSPADGSNGTPGGTKTNLNTAGIEELDALPKVGPVLAQRIVDWRTEHGRFSSVEELDAIDGVGPKMLETLLPLVTV